METNVKFQIDVEVDDQGLVKLTQVTKEAGEATDDLTDKQKENTEQSNKQDKSIGKLGSGLKGMLLTLGKMSLAYVSWNALVVDAIKKAGEQQKSERLLEQQLISTNKQLGISREISLQQANSIKELNGVLQDRLAIVDEELNQASVYFARQGANIEQMERLLTLSSDLAIVTGDDVVNSAKDLSEAFSDVGAMAGMLRSKGIAFTLAEEDMIKSMVEANKEAEAQEYIFSKLEEQIGGQAEGLADTWDGTYKKLINTVGDFQETLGFMWQGVSLEPLEDLRGAFDGLIKLFSSEGARNISATMSGLYGVLKAMFSMSIGKYLETMYQGFANLVEPISSVVNSIKTFVKANETLMSVGYATLGFIKNGWDAIAEAIKVPFELVEAFIKAMDGLDWKKIFTDPKGLAQDFSKKFTENFNINTNEFKDLVDGNKLIADGKAMAKQLGTAFTESYNKSISAMQAPDLPDQTVPAGDSGTQAGMTFADKFADEISGSKAISDSVFGVIDGISNAVAGLDLSNTLDLEGFNTQLEDLDTHYNKLIEDITNKDLELEEQRIAQDEAEEERKNAALESELNRLNSKSGAYLTAEEKQKQKELQTQKELLAEEKKKQAEEKKLAEEKAKLEQELAERKAQVEYDQALAQWTNEKANFEANKQQQIYSSSAAIAKAPVDASLAILSAGATTGLAGALAMTPIALATAGTVISSAVQLAGVANQTFNTPAPTKALFTGGSVPLEEGSTFMIGGRMGYEEQATVRGDRLFVDNSLMTQNRQSSSNGGDIIIQNITIQANDPQDFLEQLKDIARDERYK